MLQELERKVLNTIQNYQQIESGDKLVIGVSGGPDSICLLHILNKIRKEETLHLPFEIYVCHINHGLRKEATVDEQYVENYCKSHGLDCFVKRVSVSKVAKLEKIGTEEAGRKVRYEFFQEVLEKVDANKIVTAHHKNDNAETVLLHLLRGSSLNGLGGILPIREGRYIRPLIECSKEEIEEYAKTEKLNPRIDKTNQENIYTRNKIRNCLIPYIKKEFNPNIVQSINRLSNIVREENEYMEKQTEKAFQEVLIKNLKDKQTTQQEKQIEIQLNLKKFNQLELVLRRRVILYSIKQLLGPNMGIEMIHIEDILKLCSNNIGNKYLMPKKNIKILVKNKKIFFIAKHNLP
ncbi:MAG: tRNA lysidine(34) synthetase TilS [Clostridia bacterium]